MSRQRGLGKGLSELIRENAPSPQPGEVVRDLELALIDPNPRQPRRQFNAEELAALAASIEAQGLIQPIIVRAAPGGRFILIAGERRLRAVRDLGRLKIQAIVREADIEQGALLALVENLQRADLNEIEAAEAMVVLQNQYGYTTTQLAEQLGKSRPAVSNALRLLELPAAVQDLIRRGELSAGHGRAVLSFQPGERDGVARQAVSGGWSVRELERRGQQAARQAGAGLQGAVTARGRTARGAAREHRDLQTRLSEHLGTKVQISEQAGSGAISIQFHGSEDLERLAELLLRGAQPWR